MNTRSMKDPKNTLLRLKAYKITSTNNNNKKDKGQEDSVAMPVWERVVRAGVCGIVLIVVAVILASS